MTLKPRTSGIYRGISRADRHAERRQRLIVAAIRVYGGLGYRQAKIKMVCAEAGLTERYFYESFANSEELLLAAYHEVIGQLVGALEQAARTAKGSRTERTRALLRAYFTLLRREPAAARLILIEIRGVSPTVTDAYTATLRDIAERLAALFGVPEDETWQLLALGIVGGISQIALNWIGQGYAPSMAVMIDAATRLASGLFGEPE